ARRQLHRHQDRSLHPARQQAPAPGHPHPHQQLRGMSVFAQARDDLFDGPHLALEALWRTNGAGAGIPVRVILRRPDEVVGFGDSRAVLPSVLIDVRRSDVAAPAAGDTVEIAGAVYEIIAAPVADSLGLVWTCEAAKQA